MNFKISKTVFYNALLIASRAISNFSPLPAFSGIKIEVKTVCIVLVGSDSDISIKTIIRADEEESLQIYETGSIVIESKYILEIIRKMDSENIEFELIENASARIISESSEFKINGMRANEYPNIDFTCPLLKFDMKSELLKEIISQTCFATSKSETRPVLTGVNFNCSHSKLNCVATDSYRLAKKTVELDQDLDFNITIPARNLNEVMKTLDLDENVMIAVSDKKAQFVIANTLIQTRLIDGVYPETDRLIPVSYAYELEIDSQEITSAIDRASFIKNDGVSVIKLSLDEKECLLSSRSQEVGSSKENLKNGIFKGEHLDISFNGLYVFDALKVTHKGKVRFSFSGEMKPFIIQSVDDSSLLQLILPLRTYA